MSAFRNTGITDMKTKTKVKTMVAEVVLKGNPKKVPDFGMGKGILGRFEFVFKLRGDNVSSAMCAAAITNEEQKLIRDAVEVRWTDKKPRRATSSSRGGQ